MSYYIARNKNGALVLFGSKPVRNEDEGSWIIPLTVEQQLKSNMSATEICEQASMPLNPCMFPRVTWESEPQRISFMRRNLDELPYPFNEMENKIKELKSLRKNWDKRNAMPINKQAIQNLEALFEEVVAWNFDLWQISPGVVGDICISFKEEYPICCIILFANDYVYCLETDDSSGHRKDFNPQEIKALMDDVVKITLKQKT